MKKLWLVMLVGLLGCDMEAQRRDNANEASLKLVYVKDPRTNLCFATWNALGDNGLMANVPCTPEVERLLVRASGVEGACPTLPHS